MNNKIIRNVGIEIKSVDEDNGIVDARVSSGSVDRYKEIVNPVAFKKHIKSYKGHPVLLTSHNSHTLMSQIGEGIPSTLQFDESKMDIAFKYYTGEGNQEADWGFFLAKQKQAAYSIGFIGLKWDEGSIEDDGYYYKLAEGELLEISQVLIPANRDALQKMYDGGQLEEKEFNDLSGMLKQFVDECKEFDLKHAPEKKTMVRGFEMPVMKLPVPTVTEPELKTAPGIIVPNNQLDFIRNETGEAFVTVSEFNNLVKSISGDSIKEIVKNCIKEMALSPDEVKPDNIYKGFFDKKKTESAANEKKQFDSNDLATIKNILPKTEEIKPKGEK